jgi:transcriptional regulator with XRE-family HTH domain
MLQKVLQGVMDERNLSARDVGKLLGVSHTTVLRAMKGEQVDLSTLLEIAKWLKIRPSVLLDNLDSEVDIDTKIDLLTDAYPELRTVLEKAAQAVEDGQADPTIIKDIVAYAEYRIQTAGG